MKMIPDRMPFVALALLVVVLLPACKSGETPKIPGITPYRMVIQQGNFISREMVAQLKPGMSREQVRFILGTPLVTDIFHADRWDYVYFREDSNGKREQRNLSVVFENGKLARVLGDLLPSDGAAPTATGFVPLVKPETKPAAAAQPAATPIAKPAANPVAEAAPSAAVPAQSGTSVPNWSSGDNIAQPQAEPAPAPAPAPAAVAKEEEKKPPEEPKERGFFGRMLEKIGL